MNVIQLVVELAVFAKWRVEQGECPSTAEEIVDNIAKAAKQVIAMQERGETGARRNRSTELVKTYNHTKILDCGAWTVGIDEAAGHGYYEHDEYGGGGELWFEPVHPDEPAPRGVALVDYDGMFCLPRAIIDGLREAGYYLDDTFDR